MQSFSFKQRAVRSVATIAMTIGVQVALQAHFYEGSGEVFELRLPGSGDDYTLEQLGLLAAHE